MEYDVNILKVDDADAIVINYHDDYRWWTAVVDAGNVGDGVKVKRYIKHIDGGIRIIDYAFCTHPDRDHKGGFFELLNDHEVEISNFCLLRPEVAMRNDVRRLQYETGELERAAKSLYNHPTSGNNRNLIDEIIHHSSFYNISLGLDIIGMPIKLIGPRNDYFQDAAYKMAVSNADLVDEDPWEPYAEDELPSEEDAQSVMDEEKEMSPTNMSSMILFFHPQGGKFLLTGDACSASIHQAVLDYPEIKQSILKVPHHGSKHNLTTEVIDILRPTSAVISCKGSKKHPNPAIVHFLSKHCNVYSTKKSNGTLTYTSKPVTNPAVPLRKKQ